MKTIRLGVVFHQEILSGGGYQQSLNAALLVRELPANVAEVTFFSTLQKSIPLLASHGIKAKLMSFSFFEKIRIYLRMQITNARLLRLVENIERFSPFERILVNHQIDLVYFLSPTILAHSLERLNYITTVWDLCHRDDPEFPEVRWSRNFEARDRTYATILPRAAAIFVDSELGKKNTAWRYGLDQERIYVLPFQAAETTQREVDLNVDSNARPSEKYQLDLPYVFYPAQFWSHKNHVYLLEGLRLLEDQYGKRVGVIFSGGDKGCQNYIESYVSILGLQDRVRFAGFVSNDEIVALYRQSIALVMPSYFGPTNLPPLEAFQLGVPVLYPDKAGLREQVGDAALLMDLKNPQSMALHLKNLIEDKYLARRLIAAGYERLKFFESYDRVGVLQKVIEDFSWRRLCWE